MHYRFRSIDTACQPKHYSENLVGDALLDLYARKVVARKDIFIQTKFTSLNGQDPSSIPYDSDAALPDQVRQSFQKSLINLHTDYIDSYIMHSPMDTNDRTMEVWRVFEDYHSQGKVKYLGLSNTYNINTLKHVYANAIVKPSFLQNRFYAKTQYDHEIRDFCTANGIKYQSFWTLTANPNILNHGIVKGLASKYGSTKESIWYRYIQSQGMVPLCGTTSKQHMMEDIAVHAIRLEQKDIDDISSLIK
jgi:diketogulonate reductase-like aldo/keto reductase